MCDQNVVCKFKQIIPEEIIIIEYDKLNCMCECAEEACARVSTIMYR